MPVSARRSPTATPDFDHEQEFALGELDVGERMCAPRGDRDSGLLGSAIIILLLLGGGWALMRQQPEWQDWLSTKIAAVSSSAGYRPAPALDPAASVAPPPLAPSPTEMPPAPTAVVTTTEAHVTDPPPIQPPPAAHEITDAPGEGAKSATSPITTGALGPAGEPASEPLPPPKLDPTNPYQRRASAVGLHPDLSRALLARLSAADYRNAGVAIQTAVAKTPDNGTFVWPRQRKPELALFQVHFVPGAAPHCRRYVVTVTKDRWSTTAPPMEKCS